MGLYQYLLLLILLVPIYCTYNINHTFEQEVIVPKVADMIVGMPSSKFPSASLLSYIFFWA